MQNDKLTEKIIACSVKVHKELGPGFVERIYHCALKVALEEAKIDFDSEKDFSVFYQDQRVGSFKCDFFVEGKLVVFLKAQTDKISTEIEQQIGSHFKATKAPNGLLFNFGTSELEVKKIG